MSPCTCDAYKFPHRPGSGKCDNPGPNPGECCKCSYAGQEKDPYGTGDRWYSVTVCNHPRGCPWGIA